MITRFGLVRNPNVTNGWVTRDGSNVSVSSSTPETFVFLGLRDEERQKSSDGKFVPIKIGNIEILYCPSLDFNKASSNYSNIVKYHFGSKFQNVYEKNALAINRLGCNDAGILKNLAGKSQARYYMYGEVCQELKQNVPFYEQDKVWAFHSGITADNPHLHIGNNMIVKTFVKDICSRLAECGNSLFPTIEQVKFGVIDTIGKGQHQLTHCDNTKVFNRVEGHLPCFVGHIPLSEEGLFIRIEELAEPVGRFLEGTSSPQEDFCAVKNIYYVHVPKNAALFIPENTWHGGHYGSPGKPRFHMVVCPKAGSWAEDDEVDSLLVLKQVVIDYLNAFNSRNHSSIMATFPDYRVKPNLINAICKHIGLHELEEMENTTVRDPKSDEVFADFLTRFYNMEIGK